LKHINKIRNQFLKTMIQMVSAAFALVAALAWNTAISEIIKKYLKTGNTTISWLEYAIGVTIIAVLVGVYLGWLSGQIKEEELEDKEGGKK
jgi:uncharacterized membrane protein